MVWSNHSSYESNDPRLRLTPKKGSPIRLWIISYQFPAFYSDPNMFIPNWPRSKYGPASFLHSRVAWGNSLSSCHKPACTGIQRPPSGMWPLWTVHPLSTSLLKAGRPWPRGGLLKAWYALLWNPLAFMRVAASYSVIPGFMLNRRSLIRCWYD